MPKKNRKSQSETEPAERASYNPRIVIELASACILGVVVIWLIANVCFLSYKIGNQRIGLNAGSAEKIHAVNVAAASFRLRLRYPDNKIKNFPITDAGLSLDTGRSVANLNGKVSFIDRVEWWRSIPARVALSTNQTKLTDFVAQNATILVSKPTDANIAVSNGTVSLTDATIGKEYGLLGGPATIKERASRLSTKAITLATIPIDPAITQNNLGGAALKVRQIIAQHIAISIGGQTVSPTAKDVSSWLSLTPDRAEKTINFSVNSAAVNDYVDGLTEKGAQIERDQVVVKLADDSNAIAVEGQDGLRVTGQQEAEAVISKDLLEGNGLTLNLQVVDTPFQTITAADWSKWIEVNLTTKRMYAYEGTQTVNTFLVSAGKPSTPTPIGIFYIWEKLSAQTMSGPGYVQPDVPWVNYFDTSGDAIHGNYWRPTSVFGNTNTSHGCVGLQVSDAEWVYDWAVDGTPVVIHK